MPGRCEATCIRIMCSCVVLFFAISCTEDGHGWYKLIIGMRRRGACIQTLPRHLGLWGAHGGISHYGACPLACFHGRGSFLLTSRRKQCIFGYHRRMGTPWGGAVIVKASWAARYHASHGALSSHGSSLCTSSCKRLGVFLFSPTPKNVPRVRGYPTTPHWHF